MKDALLPLMPEDEIRRLRLQASISRYIKSETLKVVRYLMISQCCGAMPKVNNKDVCSKCGCRAEFVSKLKPTSETRP